MTEEDIYRRFAEAYTSFDQEGITPINQEFSQKIIQDAFDAGFSGEEIEAIHTQVYIESEPADDPEFRNLQRSAEERFRMVARIMIHNRTSMEDFLTIIDKGFDTALEKAKPARPDLDDLEIPIRRKMNQETAKKIWLEEMLK
jgi:hypothetical protein